MPGAHCEPDHDRHQHDDDRRVVDEGAEHHRGCEDGEQRDVAIEGPEPGEQPRQRLEGTGHHQRAAEDHQATDRDQCLVPEAEEDLPDAEFDAVLLVREQVEAQRQPVITIRLVTGIGMRSRVNRKNATTVNTSTAMACALGIRLSTGEGYSKKKPRLRGVVVRSGHSVLLL